MPESFTTFNRRLGKDRHSFTELNSTQEEARRRITEGTAQHGTLIVAQSQTRGRGRWNRTWHSPAGGGLYASLILSQTELGPLPTGLLTLAVGVATARVLKTLTEASVKLRWPNDLLVHGKKIGGILIEDVDHFWVVGVGINLLGTPNALPHDIQTIATTIEHETGRASDPQIILDHWLHTLDSETIPTLRKSPDTMIAEWKVLSETLGKHIEIEYGDPAQPERLQGIAHDATPAGELIVRAFDGSIKKFVSGEVIHVG